MIDFMPLSGGRGGETLLLLLTALAVDVGLSLVPMAGRLVPDRLGMLSVLARFLDARLNRPGRSEANLLVRGVVVTLALVMLAIAAGLFVAWLGQAFAWGWGPQLALLVVCLSLRRVTVDLRQGLRVLGADDLAAGRDLVGRAHGRDLDHDTTRLDMHGIGRVVIERGAVGFARGAVTPVFWFALLGFPGLFAWRAVSRAAAVTAGRDIAARAFGATAIRLDHVLGLLPSTLAGWLLAVAALVVPQARVDDAFKTMSRDAGRDEIVNDGRLKGAAAGALGLALGGPSGTNGTGGARDAWIGDGRARVGQGDVRRMLYLTAVASLLLLALVAALTAIRL